MDRKFRFHIMGLPHTVTNKEFSGCAYTQKVLKFGKMMKERGHTIIHYGHEDSDLICDEHVTTLTNEDFEKSYGNHNWKENFFKFDMNDHAYRTFYRNTISEISKRKQPGDFVLPFWGLGHKPVCDAFMNELIIVEPGIGYAEGHFAEYRIFESYAIRSAIGGYKSVGTCMENNYHVVIPNYFDPEDFDYMPDEKEDYFLFMGRCYVGKGIHIAYQAAIEAGVKLKIAGQGWKDCGYTEVPGQVEYIGYVNAEQRKPLLAKAKGFYLASQYNEPFGGAAVEAMFSGTPIITSDWGVFNETNLHGVTGYRCRNFDDYVWATKLINEGKISPQACREWAMNNYSLERVGEMYEKYFNMVYDVYNGNGWYHRYDQPQLDWLNRYYPSELNNDNLQS